MDRLDIIGAAGLALIAAGVWELAGWSWTSILIGLVFSALYVVREVRSIAR